MYDDSFRRIHLDFHTHPAITDVCGHFDPERFADTLLQAHVDDVILFAKDHYGYAFFASQTNPVHPHLKNEFLAQAVDACRVRGIRTEAYISACLDHETFKAHPDWACKNADGSNARWSAVNVLLDLASPLLDEIIIPFTKEVVSTIPADGLWFDIVMYPTDGFYSAHLTAILTARGIEDTPDNRGQLARDITVEAQQRLVASVKAIRQDIAITFNNQAIIGDTLAYPYSEIIAIESDPSFWPQFDLPLRCRLVNSSEKAHYALTTRFHRTWGDFGGMRSPAQLQTEVGMIFAAGTSRVSIGDHLHPSGILDDTVYQNIAQLYEHCAKVAPIVDNSTPLAEVSIVVPPHPDPYGSSTRDKVAFAQLGMVRACVEEHLQFSVRDANPLLPTDEVLLLPGGCQLPDETLDMLRSRVAAGQPIIAFGEHIRGFADLMGTSSVTETQLSGQYLVCEEAVADAHIGSNPIAVYRKALTFQPHDQAEILAYNCDPLFDETFPENYHSYGPIDWKSPRRPVIVQQGQLILCGIPLPELLHVEGAWAHFEIMQRLLKRLIGRPLLSTNAGPSIEIALHRREQDLVIHCVTSRFSRPSLSPARIRNFEPTHGLSIMIPSAGKPTETLRVTPGPSPTWEYHDALSIDVDLLSPHEVFIFRNVLE